MRLKTMLGLLGLGYALVLIAGCGSSQPSSGLWSCFDTGSQVACTQVSALFTADTDVNGDGVPDHFVCADDDDDGHDRNRDHDQSGLFPSSGHDGDHDGVDDELDCDHRDECESLSNNANPDRHHDGEIEDEHDGGEEDGGHHNRGPGGGDDGGHDDDGTEIHDEHTCSAPKLPF